MIYCHNNSGWGGLHFRPPIIQRQLHEIMNDNEEDEADYDDDDDGDGDDYYSRDYHRHRHYLDVWYTTIMTKIKNLKKIMKFSMLIIPLKPLTLK